MQIRSVVAVAALGLASTPALAQQAVQWRFEDGGNGHWYARRNVPLPDTSFLTAATLAAAEGGMLATVHTIAENEVVRTVNDSWWSYWVGGTQVDPACSGVGCVWQWQSGESWTVDIWCCGGFDDDVDGNEDCLAASGDGLWNSVPCVGGPGMRHYIIEWSADCNTDGIVDYGQILDGTFEDANQNGVPDCCDDGGSCEPCPGDITGGGQVNGVDLAAILGAWGTDGQGKFDCDINDDATVDAQDLAIVLGGWGNCP